MIGRLVRTGLAGAVLGVGVLATAAGATTTGSSGATGPSGATGSRFQRQQTELEQALALRTTRLQDLVNDVSGAKTLSSAHADLLSARLATEQASIAALTAKVPTDTTLAEVAADRQAMLRDNRVFAVMSPQVFETIGGDAVLATAAGLQGEQSSLLSEVNSLVGDPGYHNALTHYTAFVRRLAGVDTNIARVETNVLAQTPQGYPGNQRLFVNANIAVRNANVTLAYASYDASVIALASGGYTGS